jgi:hypothetical protein
MSRNYVLIQYIHSKPQVLNHIWLLELGKSRLLQKYGPNVICLKYVQIIYYAFIEKFVLGDVRIYGYLGSKKNNYQALFKLGEGLTNDLDGGSNIIPLTIKDDSTIITLVDALTLKKHITSEDFKNSTPKYPEKKKEFEKLATSLKETDNPVLVLVRLKK